MASAQKAIFPIDDLRITAGYKSKGYTSWFYNTYKIKGVKHYGIDMTDRNRKNLTLKAPFDMKIIFAGYDYFMGNSIIAVSTQRVDVHNGKYKGSRYLAIRMAHLGKISVKTGQTIKQGTVLGNYGKTGRYGGVNHLHLEISTNYKNAKLTPTVRSRHWIRGADSTIQPMDVLKMGPGQTFSATYWSSGMSTDDTMTLDHKDRKSVV